MQALLRRLRAHDGGTYAHARSVGRWCRRLALELGASGDQAEYVERCGALHDVGKLHTPLAILHKPGPLTPDEWQTMRAHAADGGDLCEATPGLERFAPVVRAHHERPDGRGYPLGPAARDVPLAARIVTVTDALHAMISNRCYAPAMAPHAALAELARGRGTQFDATAVDAMFRVLGYRVDARRRAARIDTA